MESLKNALTFLTRFHNDEKGQGMTEYIIIVVLISVAAVALVVLFGGKIKTLFTKANTGLDTAISGSGTP